MTMLNMGVTHRKQIRGPFPFEKCVITGDNFLTMMENTAFCHVSVGIVFQLNGAPPHFYRRVPAFLQREFPDHWTGRG
jgi:hypothetical protein